MKTVIIIISPKVECYGSFKKMCNAKGLIYQSLANLRKNPKIDEVVEIDGMTVTRVEKH